MTTYQPGDQVRVRDADDKVYEVVSGAFGLGSLIIIRDPDTGEQEAMPESWLTSAALRDLPPEPPLPPEPTEPGTVVWDRDGRTVAMLTTGDGWIDPYSPPEADPRFTWRELPHATCGPLTTRQPGTIPAEAADDDRAEEWTEVHTDALNDNGTVGAMRAVLARIRTWQPT